LREWNLIATGPDPNLATLKSVTAKQTPHFTFLQTSGGRDILREFLDQNRTAILDGTHVVPDTFVSSSSGPVSFQTGDARNDCGHPMPTGNCHSGNPLCLGFGTRWWAPGYVPQCNGSVADGEVRHKFALQTCSGCHFTETGVNFSQVSNRLTGQESSLSSFLTGVGYPIDDVFFGSALPHSFGDLDHRASVLTRMLGLDCNGNALQDLQDMQGEMGSRVE
jgi:hypothetical protein